MGHVSREQGNVAKIKREEGKIGQPISGKFLPMNKLHYQSKKSLQTRGNKGIFSREHGEHVTSLNDPHLIHWACPQNG